MEIQRGVRSIRSHTFRGVIIYATNGTNRFSMGRLFRIRIAHCAIVPPPGIIRLLLAQFPGKVLGVSGWWMGAAKGNKSSSQVSVARCHGYLYTTGVSGTRRIVIRAECFVNILAAAAAAADGVGLVLFV